MINFFLLYIPCDENFILNISLGLMSDFLSLYFFINSYKHRNDHRIIVLIISSKQPRVTCPRERREIILSNDLILLVCGIEITSWNLEETNFSIRVSFSSDPHKIFIR